MSYLGKTLEWEKGRQLKKFGDYEFTYNANGIRTSKKSGTTTHTYILDGAKILKETWGSSTLIPLYDNEDAVCGIVYNNTPYYFIKNLQGDVIAITNSSAAVVAKYSYDAWGVPTIISDTSGIGIASINPFRYRSYYYDTETQLYHLQSRYYDPVVGRFINGDEVPTAVSNSALLSRNMFCYCENDPINNDDVNGGISWKSVKSFFDILLKVSDKIIKLLKTMSEGMLKLYTSLSPKDITQIARDINVHRKDARKAISSLTNKYTKIKSTCGKIAIAISIISLLVSISSSLTSGNGIIDLVSHCIVDGLVEAIKFLLDKIVSLVLKAMPMVGIVLGFIISAAFGIVLDLIFSTSFVKKITTKFKSMVNIKLSNELQYLRSFFKSVKSSK